MADPSTTENTNSRKKNTEEIKKLNQLLAKQASEKKREQNLTKNDPASFRSYIKEQTIGKFNLSRFLPREVQVGMGIFKDLKGILEAKQLKKQLNIENLGSDGSDISDMEGTPTEKNRKKNEIIETPEDNNTNSDIFVQMLSTLEGIKQILMEGRSNEKFDKLDRLENERENSRKQEKIVEGTESIKEDQEESKGIFSTLLGFFKDPKALLASFSGILGSLGGLLSGLGTTLMAALGPIAAVLGVVALGATIAVLAYKIFEGIQDLVNIEKETETMLSEQRSLDKQREEGRLFGRGFSGTQAELVTMLLEENEKTQTVLSSKEEDQLVSILNPSTMSLETVTVAQAKQIFSRENLEPLITEEEFQQERENRLNRRATVTVASDSITSERVLKQVAKEEFLDSLTQEETETLIKADKKLSEYISRTSATPGFGAFGVSRPTYTDEENELMKRRNEFVSSYDRTEFYRDSITEAYETFRKTNPAFSAASDEQLKEVTDIQVITHNDDAGLRHVIQITPKPELMGSVNVGASDLETSEVTSKELQTEIKETGQGQISQNIRQGDTITNASSTTVYTSPERRQSDSIAGIFGSGFRLA